MKNIIIGIVSYIFAPKRSGVIYLKNELSKLGVNPESINTESIKEFVNNSYERASFYKSKNNSKSTQFLENLETDAIGISMICFGDYEGEYSKLKDGIEKGSPTPWLDILAKHDKRFSIENLQETQSNYKNYTEQK